MLKFSSLGPFDTTHEFHHCSDLNFLALLHFWHDCMTGASLRQFVEYGYISGLYDVSRILAFFVYNTNFIYFCKDEIEETIAIFVLTYSKTFFFLFHWVVQIGRTYI